MDLMIASDLHGSPRHCEALLKAFRREKADRLLLLGDLLYRDFQEDLPGDVIEMLNGMADKIWSVKGNCDARIDQMALHFPMMADFALLHIEGKTLYAAHGHKEGPGNPPPLQAGDFLLCGHTHIPACRKMGGATYLNPGSVSLPKAGSPHSYMMLRKGLFTWHALADGVTFQPT